MPGTFTLYNREEGINLAVRVDKASTTISYIGEALADTLDATPLWRIKKVDSSSGVTVISWAGGNAYFDKSWSSRLTYTYS